MPQAAAVISIGRAVISVGTAIYKGVKSHKAKKAKKARARADSRQKAEDKKERNEERVFDIQSNISLTDQDPKELTAQKLIVGEVTVGGTKFLEEDEGPYLVEGYVFAGHPIDGFRQISLDGNLLFVGLDGYVYSDPYHKPRGKAIARKAGTDSNFEDIERNYLRVSTKKGSYPGTPVFTGGAIRDPILRDRLGFPETYNHLGNATVVLEYFRGQEITNPREDDNASLARMQQEEREGVWASEKPGQMLARLRGAPVWDPRDPTQDKDNERTYKWDRGAYNHPGRNAALVIAFVMQHRLFGAGITYDDFDIPALIEAANFCDKGFDPGDGRPPIPQYTIDDVIQTGEGQAVVLDNLLSACNGSLLIRNGKYIIDIDRPRDPVDIITDQDLVADFEYSEGIPSGEVYNKISAEFRDLSLVSKGQRTEAPTVEVNLPGIDTTNELALNLRATSDHARAQFISRILLRRQLYTKELTLTIDAKGLKYHTNDVITVQSQKFPYIDGDYQIDSIDVFESEGAFILELSEFNNDIFREGPEIEVKDYTRVAVVPTGPRISVASVAVNEILENLDFLFN